MESQELAKVLGISNVYLSQLEKGIRTCSSAKLLDKMAKVLNKAEIIFNGIGCSCSFYFLRSALSGTEIFYAYTK